MSLPYYASLYFCLHIFLETSIKRYKRMLYPEVYLIKIRLADDENAGSIVPWYISIYTDEDSFSCKTNDLKYVLANFSKSKLSLYFFKKGGGGNKNGLF